MQGTRLSQIMKDNLMENCLTYNNVVLGFPNIPQVCNSQILGYFYGKYLTLNLSI